MRRAPAPRLPLLSLPVLLAIVTSGAGCKKDYPALRVQRAATYEQQSCKEAQPINSFNGSSARVTFLLKDGNGQVYDFCDASYDLAGGNTAGPDVGAARVDVYLDVFQGAVRVGSGVLLDVDPTKAPEQTLLVYDAERFSCAASANLDAARAFHTATALPDGNVLFVGGLITDPKDTTKEAAESNNVVTFYGTDSVELYDANKREMVKVSTPGPVRAFHQATVLPTSDGTTRILLSGGVTVDDATAQLAQIKRNDGNGIPASFRFSFLPAAKVAPTELIIYDPSTPTPTVTRSKVPAALQAVAGALQAAAATTGGALLAGGVHDTAAPVADKTLVSSADGMTAKAGSLLAARAGSALVAIPDASGKSAFALQIGGLAAGGDMASAFERIDLGTLTATAANPSTTVPALPAWFLPTVVAMDADTDPQPRLLIAGGLGVKTGLAGDASNPPEDRNITMFQVRWTTSGDLPTLVVPAAGFGGMVCSGDTQHFKPVAWNAATRVQAGDRVIVTGGTPRDDTINNCRECEDAQDSLACAVSQAVTVSIPPAANGTPQLSPLGAPLSIPRFGHTQTLLRDGNLLITGGITRRDRKTFAEARTEILNPMHREAPAQATPHSIQADVDDPLLQVPQSAAIVREHSGLAHAKDGDPSAPVRPCGQPKSS